MLSLASVGILMIAFSNLVTFLPVLNKRVFANGGLYILAYLLLLYNSKLKRQNSFNIMGFNVVTYMSLPLIFFFIFTQLSQIGDFTDARIFISPLVYWLFEGDNSLKELLRDIII
jgi:drug/metabolite transporter superfamily protein YnfA